MPRRKPQPCLTFPRQYLDTLRGAVLESLGALGEILDSGLPPALDALQDASHALEARAEADELNPIIALQIRLGEHKIRTARESVMRVIALLRQAQKELARLSRTPAQSRSPKRAQPDPHPDTRQRSRDPETTTPR